MSIEEKMPRSFVPSSVKDDERYISREGNSLYAFNTFDGNEERSVVYPYEDVKEFVLDEEMHTLMNELQNIYDERDTFTIKDLIAVEKCIRALKNNNK